MSIQTVENTSCRVDYDGDGARVDFPTTFAFLANGHLVVEVSADDGVTWVTQTLDDDYEVAGADAPEPGGTVTFDTAPAVDTIVRIERRTPITQEEEMQTSGPLPAKIIMRAFAKLTMICQENARDVADALAGTTGSTYTAVRITDTFTVLDPLETTWPRAIAAGVAPASCVIGRIVNNLTPGEVLDQPPSLQWAPSGNNVSVKRISGLTVGENYTVTFEVRS